MSTIPETLHFSYFRGTNNWVWRDIHTLCLMSAVRNTTLRPVVHYDRAGEGPWWEMARRIHGVEWREATYSGKVNGYSVSDQRLPADVYRLSVLEAEGGVYADLDFVFLRDLRPLLDSEAFIGTQNAQKKKLACGLMGAKPGAAFIVEYRKAYAAWAPQHERKFWQYANCVPWELAKKHPCTVLPRKVFYPWAWSNKTFLKGVPVGLKQACAVHLWESIQPDLTTEDLVSTEIGPWVVPLLVELQQLNPASSNNERIEADGTAASE